MLASENGPGKMVEMLLGKGAGMDLQSKFGRTALMLGRWWKSCWGRARASTCAQSAVALR